MNKPVITVIIPVYNTEKYLEECIDTVLGQSFSQFELICVEDGSTDGSKEILDAYAMKDSRVKVLSQQNKYAGVARNYGLTKAEGEYIIFLDSDDFFETDMLQNLYDKAKEFNADICVCDAKNYFEASGRFGKPKQYFDKEKIPKKQPFSYKTNPDYIFNFTTPAPWNMLYKKSFIVKENLKFQEIKRANDLRFFGTAIIKANAIVTVDKRLVNYRVRESGNLQSQNDETPLGFYNALLQVREEILEMGIMQKIQKSFMNHALSVFTYNMNSLKTAESFKILHEKFFQEAIKLFYIDQYREEDIYSETTLERFKKYKSKDIQGLLNEFYNGQSEEKRRVLYNSKTKDPKVSVIIPIYNTEKYIEKCIGSVQDQTIKDIEVVCINDGSTDRSLEVLKNMADKDDRITLIDKENEGLSATRNLGMELAKGEYISFLDSDDYLENDALEILFKKADAENLDILFFNTHVRFFGKITEQEKEGFSKYYRRVRDYQGNMAGIDLYVKMNRVKEYRVSVCMQFYKSSFLKEKALTFHEGILHEDNLFTYKTILQAKRTGYLKNKLYNRTIRKDSIMTSPATLKNFIGYFTCYAQMLEFLILYENGKEFNDETKSFLGASINTVYNSAMKIYRNLSDEEISDISFPENSTEERLYWYIKRPELEIRKIRKSKTFKTGKVFTFMPGKIKSKIKKHMKGQF